MTGMSSSPSSESEYATDGGDVGTTRRWRTPLPSSTRSRALRTFAEMRGMSVRSSPNRRGPALRYQMRFGVHAPPSSFMHSVSGHAGGGSDTLLFRRWSAIDQTGYRADTTIARLLRVTSCGAPTRGYSAPIEWFEGEID